MDSHAKNVGEQSFSSLIGGIADEAKELLVQEIALAKLEVQHELNKAKSAAVHLVLGILALGIGGILLAFMLATGLAAWTGIPLWECYGIVGTVSALLGWVVLSIGSSRPVKSLKPMDTPRTVARRMESAQ